MNDLWTTSDSTKKLLELINEFSTNKFNKVTEGKINVPKSMYCFCRLIVNYQKEIKNKKTVPFKLASKRMNYIGINLRR